MYRVRRSWYDEAFCADGTPRAPYAARSRRTGSDPLAPGVEVAERLRDRPLEDDTRILPVPVVLDDHEYRSVIRPGVVQRARALQHLFADLVLAGGRVMTAELGVAPQVIREVVALHGYGLGDLRSWWRNGRRQRIRFTYGPDLVRALDGRWTVLEDNVGCVGGTADGNVVADCYRAATGSTLDCRPPADLAVAVRGWLQRLTAAAERSSAAVAVLGCEEAADPWAVHLDENARRRRILDELGVPVTGRDEAVAADAQAVVNFDVDPSWLGLVSPGRDLLNAPGTGVLGNKALLPFVPDAIRLLLGEEPILPTPDTRLMVGNLVPADGGEWVVKSAAGCQGTEVVLPLGLSAGRLRDLPRRVGLAGSGGYAVAQRYVEPSRLTPGGPTGWDSYGLEIRPIAYVLGWDDVVVGDQPVGKAVSSYDAWRLNNISRGACYVPVLREPCPCCVR